MIIRIKICSSHPSWQMVWEDLTRGDILSRVFSVIESIECVGFQPGLPGMREDGYLLIEAVGKKRSRGYDQEFVRQTLKRISYNEPEFIF